MNNNFEEHVEALGLVDLEIEEDVFEGSMGKHFLF